MDSMNGVRNIQPEMEYIGVGNGNSEVDYTKLGTKGQIIEGTIAQVSDKVSINFDGMEIKVAQSSVRNAREGEIRNFQIMEVSKQKIVLKEVENSISSSGNSGSILRTTIEANQTSFEEVLEASVEEDEEETASKEDLDSVSSRMTGEDYNAIEEEGISVESYNLKRLERALNRIKEQRLARQAGIEAAVEGRQEYDEEVQKIVLQNVVSSVVGAGMAQQIAHRLNDANLPVTAENIKKIANSLEMSSVVTQMSDKAMNYLIDNELDPTIQNIYHAQYAGDSKQYRDYVPDYGNGFQSTAVNYKGATPRKDHAVVEENWQQVKPQVEKILEDAGWEVNAKAIKQAKWLFSNELPITEDTLQRLDQLHTIKNEYDQESLLVDIVESYAKGQLLETVSLAKNKMEVTNQSVEAFLAEVEKQIKELDEQSQCVTDAEENISDVATNIENITKRRQLEEIRLKMSLQAAKNLQDKGIELNIDRMEEIVEELRNIEKEYYRGILYERNVSDTPENIEILRNTTDSVNELRQAPSYILGSTLSKAERIDLTELKQEGQAMKVTLDRAGEVYDTLMTQPRKDLGDNIEKAFNNIDNILDELNMEATTANQRAVKILGYNGMEITEDNIFAVKEYDAKVNKLMSDLHPAVTVEMIKRGIDPLNTPIVELDEQINNIKEEIGVTGEEKYSKYLWKLERQEGISPADREAYIGIYRLLNNVQKTNGAAVGHVLQTNREMTLHNLLSAVVTAKRGQIDAQVDDNSGFAELKYTREPLILELNEIFGANQEKDEESFGQKGRYFDMLVNELSEQITPSKLAKTMVDTNASGGQPESFMNKNVEQLLEEWRQMNAKEELDAEYEEEMVKNIRELSDNSEKAITFLNTYKIPVTIQNLFAANQILSEQSVFRELRGKSKQLSKEIREQTENAMDGLMDALEDKETMQEQYRRLQDSMEAVLNERYAEKEVTSKELSELKMLSNGMNLIRSLSKRESYEIPVLAGDNITNIHLTIVNGSKDSGKVQIGMDSEQLGNVTAEFTFKQDKVNGMVLCLSRKAADTMQAGMENFTKHLSDVGIQTGHISYGLKTVSKEFYQATKEQRDSTKNTKRLYQVAKAFVKHISALENA